MATYPTQNLQPGMTGDAVKQLQDYLVSIGLMTPEQIATGYGTYGPKTTAAVKTLQEKLGVDNSSGPGYFGPRTMAALSQQQNQQTQQNSSITGNADMDNLLGEVQKHLDGLLKSGQTVNPNIEITPREIQGFLDQAAGQINPYYQSQFAAIKKNLSSNLDILQKNYDLNKENELANFTKTLGDNREADAQRGITFSGVRGKQEQQFAATQNRQLQSNDIQMQNQARSLVGTAESQIGSRNLAGFSMPQFNSATATTSGQGSFLPSRTLDYYNPSNTTGSLEYTQAGETRQLGDYLATQESRKRALNPILYP